MSDAYVIPIRFTLPAHPSWSMPQPMAGVTEPVMTDGQREAQSEFIDIASRAIYEPKFTRVRRRDKPPEGYQLVKSRIRRGYRLFMYWPISEPDLFWVSDELISKLKVIPWPLKLVCRNTLMRISLFKREVKR